jgi:hypothetical protein
MERNIRIRKIDEAVNLIFSYLINEKILFIKGLPNGRFYRGIRLENAKR